MRSIIGDPGPLMLRPEAGIARAGEAKNRNAVNQRLRPPPIDPGKCLPLHLLNGRYRLKAAL